jgi:putative transposase
MLPPFHSNNTSFAYQIRFHFGFNTHGRQSVFCAAADLKIIRNLCGEVCTQSNIHLLELEAEINSIRLLVSLMPDAAPARTVQTLKANLSRRWNLQQATRLRWSRGYFFRSVGDVTADTVSNYIASQRQRHGDQVRLLCEFNHPQTKSILTDRSYNQCVGQYAAHIVFCPVHHMPALDTGLAKPLLAIIQSIAAKRGFELVRLAILEDHVHALVAPPPTMSPSFVAFALMNNTSHWLRRTNPGLFSVWDVPGVWNPSAYIGTVGDVTSQHVRNSLRQIRA